MKTKKALQKLTIIVVSILMLATVTGVILSVTAAETTPTLTILGKTLTLESNINIRYYIKVEGASPADVEMLYWTAPSESYQKGDEDLSSKTVGLDPNGSGGYAFDYTELSAKQMIDDIYARAYVEVDGVGYYSEVIKYSVLQYAYNQLNKSTTTENLRALLHAMLDYGAAAQEQFGYQTDRLANAGFYQISVEGGALENGITSGLYLPGETVTLTAPESDSEDSPFAFWRDEAGEIVSYDNPCTVTVGAANKTYHAVHYTPERYFTFTLLYNDTYSIKAKNISDIPAEVILPVKYQGKPVTEIAVKAFEDCSMLESIMIGDSVTIIRDKAFATCRSLTSIVIPDSLGSIRSSAFYRCQALASVHVSDLTAWCNISFEGSDSNPLVKNLYLNGAWITDLVIPVDVTSIGPYTFQQCSGLKSITIHDGVTSIGDSAFSYCSGLDSVTIPGSVTSIGRGAFHGCRKLKSVTLESGVESIGADSFKYCYQLSNVTIPDSVAFVGDCAFECCYELSSIIIPNSIKSIGGHAFDSCSSLPYNIYDNAMYLGNESNPYLALIKATNTSILSCAIHENARVIANSAFSSCSSLASITIPEHVTSIGDGVFSGCSSLAKVTLPNNITSIGNNAFYYCKALAELTIPDGVTSIGNRAFSECLGITSITIPDGVTSLGNYAFAGCSSLASITIPDSVTTIGSSAFADCSKITSITLPFVGASETETNKKYFGYIFGASSYSKQNSFVPSSLQTVVITGGTNIASSAFRGCTNLTNIIVENGVTSIGNSAFSGCTNLTNVIVEDGVTSIGDSAFSGCTSLINVVLPNSLTNIRNYMFSNCSGLIGIEIPDGVTNIGGGAFSGCSGLISVEIPDGVTNIGSGAFSGCSGLISVEIPDSVTSIDFGAFSGCASLASITLPFVGNCIKEKNEAYQYPLGYIFGSGEYAGGTATTQSYYVSFPYSLTSTTYYIPTSLKSVTITGGNILYGAFINCSNLTSITIGDNITSIEGYAFAGCLSVEDVAIGDGVSSIDAYAFYKCSKLTNVYISDVAAWCNISFAHYASNPLYYAENLYLDGILVSDLMIPDGVTSIGASAFSGCTGLMSVIIGNDVASIGNSAFSGCTGLTSVIIGNGVENIGNSAFLNCTELASIDISDSVTSIEKYAFSGCTKLESIDIPDTVTSIESAAFSGCTKLSNVIIGNGVARIGNSAFSDCSSLTSIMIPAGVTSISSHIFSGCTSLTSIIVAADNPIYRSVGNCLIETESKNLIAGCKNSIIPTDGSVTCIDSPAFFRCLPLTSITIPDGVTSIGSYAFFDCTNLTSITIPDSVTDIGSSSFAGCTSLANIYYTGTLGEWNAIAINSSDNSCLTSATCYYYSETEPTDTENLYWHYVDGVPTPW